ncbi:MAG: hypothetical protein Q8O40_02725 [Chloroflexota bacterium]|nr:hypothetical protein [Chloroflexota bacterium]
MSTKKLNYHNYRVDVLLAGKPATWYVSVPIECDIEGGIGILLVALGRLRRRAPLAFQVVGVQYRQREPVNGPKLVITEDQRAWAAPDVWEQLGLGREACARAEAAVLKQHSDTPGRATPDED